MAALCQNDVSQALLGVHPRPSSFMTSCVGWRGSHVVKSWCASGGRTCSSAWSACRRSSGTPSRRAPAPRATRCWRTSRAMGRGRRCLHLQCLATADDCLATRVVCDKQCAGPGRAAVVCCHPLWLCRTVGGSLRVHLRLAHRCVLAPDTALLLCRLLLRLCGSASWGNMQQCGI